LKQLTKIGFIFYCCIFFFQIAEAQNFKSHFDQIYGLDSKLYNGYVYNGFYGSTVKGQPFLYTDYLKGDITLEGKKYQNLLLNYDVFNQLLVLKFKTTTGADMTIELPFFKISEFNIGENHFILQEQSDSSFQIYQIIGNKQKAFWLKHEKKLELETISQQYEYQFTRGFIRFYYAINPNQLVELNKNKSLVKLIEKEKQKQLKRWLRKKRIKIHKATPQQLKSLSQYLNQL